MIHETLVWAETDADPMFDPVPLTHHQWIQLHPPMTHSDPTHVESRADGPLELRITGRTLAVRHSCSAQLYPAVRARGLGGRAKRFGEAFLTSTSHHGYG